MTLIQESPNSDQLFDFCVEISRRMIMCGANIERIQVLLYRIFKTYHIKDESIYLQSNFISIGGRLSDGTYVARQLAIPPSDYHLQRLKKLNRLCYRIVDEQPPVGQLMPMLEEASAVTDYPQWVVNLAQIGSLSCVCMMFGGGLTEVLSVV